MIERSTKLHEKLVKKVLSDPEGLQEYHAFKIQLELAEKLKAARQKAHFTQEVVAKRMETNKSVVARLEAAGGKDRHSPSLTTLIRYANAIGYDLNISLKPQKHFND